MDKPDYDRETSALLLIDLQPDFFPGGALGVAGGDSILPGVKKLMNGNAFPLKVATQDWHPPDHVSFADVHEGREPFETIRCHGHDQTLWPPHCVQGTAGAALHPELPWDKVDAILRKGRAKDADSYSGFRNNDNPEGNRPPTGLSGYLKEKEVDTIVLCGLARDVCVLWTALDGVRMGFKTFFLWDLTRAVNPDQDEQTYAELKSKGVRIIQQEQVWR